MNAEKKIRAYRPYASDAPVREELVKLGYTDLRTFAHSDGTPRSKRAQIRYLAALFPELDMFSLAEQLHAVIANQELSIADIRIVLDGRHLNDASKKTGEVPIEAVQLVGRILSAGGTRLAASRDANISVDTVVAIDEYLGLTERYDERLMDVAVIAVREGWSVRNLATVTGMSKSRAHRYLQKARSVLVELQEVK
jgi:hypothetical protein